MAAIAESKYIWKNGELVKWADATTHILTHALHYGTAVFEGARLYKTPKGSALFRISEHYERLHASGHIIDMTVPFSVEQLIEATKLLISENNLDCCYIRPIVYRGYGSMGVNPRPAPIDTAIAVWPWEAYLGQEALDNGIAVGISSWRQRASNATPAAVKSSAGYLNSGLAHMEALDHGYGEAILLSESGYVAEGSGENVFIFKDKGLITPPLSDGVLNGITRNSIITLAGDLGLTVKEQSLVRSDLYTADEVFFTGTAAEVTPISSVDNRQVANGKAGKVTKQLQAAFFGLFDGSNDSHPEWLTYL